jgi:hypothetical protein
MLTCTRCRRRLSAEWSRFLRLCAKFNSITPESTTTLLAKKRLFGHDILRRQEFRPPYRQSSKLGLPTSLLRHSTIDGTSCKCHYYGLVVPPLQEAFHLMRHKEKSLSGNFLLTLYMNAPKPRHVGDETQRESLWESLLTQMHDVL